MGEMIPLILILVLAVPAIALAAVLLYLLLVGGSGIWWALKSDDPLELPWSRHAGK